MSLFASLTTFAPNALGTMRYHRTTFTMTFVENRRFFVARHILLLTGIATIILSFLFFGRATLIYGAILLAGIFMSLLGFLCILFRDAIKRKVFWTIVIFISILVQWATESLMIRFSYIIYVRQNEDAFSQINKILLAKPGNVSWFVDSSLHRVNSLTHGEWVAIKGLVGGKEISLIAKDDWKIFYRTYGMFDVSHGVYYFRSAIKPGERYTHLRGNWYSRLPDE